MHDYYLSKKGRLLRLFDFTFRPIWKKLAEYYGQEYAENIIDESRQNFLEIIPQMPYVGGMKNYYTPIIVVNGIIVAMFRAMRKTGKSAEDVMRIWAEVVDDLFRKIPGPLARLGGRVLLSKQTMKAFEKQTHISQERQYPEDWVYELLVGDGDKFDVGFEFSECAVIKFYDAMGVMELAPYCNFGDVTYSHYLGIGLDASETLGMGCDHCRMTFKKGGETLITPNLVDILPLAKKTTI
jgi:hypothetical protein